MASAIGSIAKAADNRQQMRQQRPPTPGTRMQQMIKGGLKEQFKSVLGNNAEAFIGSVIDLYSSDSKLAECEPGKVLLEALKAATLDLPINKQLGFAYIVPYKEKGIQTPHFQIGYKGLIQLCMRSGAYKYLNAGCVYEGMEVKTDVLTGEVDINGEPESDGIIGYFAYLETLNGFKKAAYWTKEKVQKHAQKFSKSYEYGSSVWQSDFDSMAQKTVLRNLLSKWGVMSVQMSTAMVGDLEEVNEIKVIPGNDNEPDVIEDAEYSIEGTETPPAQLEENKSE